MILEASSLCDFKDLPEFQIDLPKNKAHGDYACNLAMQLAKPLKKNPREIASLLRDALLSHFGQEIAKVEIAGPGFLNLFLKASFSHRALQDQVSDEGKLLMPDLGKNRRALIEFVSANPTGPLHIGHGRNAVVGDVLANLLEAFNYQVEREFYINDHGVQIQNLGRSSLHYLQKLSGLEAIPLGEKDYRGEYLENIVAELQGELKEFGEDLYLIGKRVSSEVLALIKKTLQDCNLEFDRYFSESSLYENQKIESVLESLKKSGRTYEEEGALWFKTTDYGDDKDRVLIKSDASYTYLTPDIAYHQDKFERNYDLYINVLGADHGGYLKRIWASIAALGYDEKRLKFLLMQLVNVVEGQGEDKQAVKMSKRAGTVVRLQEVLDDVGVDATRFFLIMRSHNMSLDFDLNLAKEKSSENPVYYVQYAHARTASILRKAAEAGYQSQDYLSVDLSTLVLPEEMNLIKTLLEFEEHVQTAIDELEPHRIAFFTLDLAKSFQAYYTQGKSDDQYRVISDNKKTTCDKLFLIYVLKQYFALCLKIIGVSAPESM